MPYKAKGKCVYKADTGEKVGCTKGPVNKYLAALHVNVPDAKNEVTTRGKEELVLTEALIVAANYIVRHGDAGVKEVERQLAKLVLMARQRQKVQESIKGIVKEVLSELTAK